MKPTDQKRTVLGSKAPKPKKITMKDLQRC